MRLTLDESWELCLKQWPWIIKQLDGGSKEIVEELKDQWLEENGFTDICICNECFFCEYAYQHDKSFCPTKCPLCPGRKIDTDFFCLRDDYHYQKSPHKFYEKLLSLNKKRKKKGNSR